jgi:hypothetical protein
MIFSKRAQKICREWREDFRHAPEIQGAENKTLLAALEKAAAGGDLKTRYASEIAAQAWGNLSLQPPQNQITAESDLLLHELQHYFDIERAGPGIAVSKKPGEKGKKKKKKKKYVKERVPPVPFFMPG